MASPELRRPHKVRELSAAERFEWQKACFNIGAHLLLAVAAESVDKDLHRCVVVARDVGFVHATDRRQRAHVVCVPARRNETSDIQNELWTSIRRH